MRALPLFLFVLTGLGLGFFVTEERGAPRIRFGPLSMSLALGVSNGTGVPEPASTLEPELVLTQLATPPTLISSTPLQGEGAGWEASSCPMDSGAWVAETRQRMGLLRMILIPESQSRGAGSPAPRTAGDEMLERLLELEAHLDRQRLYLIRKRIS